MRNSTTILVDFQDCYVVMCFHNAQDLHVQHTSIYFLLDVHYEKEEHVTPLVDFDVKCCV
jgi:hypothetical protein